MTQIALPLCAMDVDDVDETLAGIGPADETELLPAAAATGIELAWSDEPETAVPEPRSWRAASALAGGVVLAGVVAAVGVALGGRGDHHQAPTGAAPVPAIPTATTPTAPTLDGTYMIDFQTQNATYRGNALPAPGDMKPESFTWWAFHSTCGPDVCSVTGVGLADDHQTAKVGGETDVLNFVNGQWEDATPASMTSPCSSPSGAKGVNTSSMRFEFKPLPDGTLHGTDTRTITASECGYTGNTLVIPIVLTRVGPRPAGVIPGVA